MRRQRLRQRLAQTGMGQAEIIVHVIQGQLLAQASLVFAQCGDPPPNSGHMLAYRQVDALDKGRVDLPAAGRQHLLDRLQRAEHDPVPHADQAPASHGLDHLRVEQWWQRHPARLGSRALDSLALRLYPVPIVREQGGHVLLKSVRQKQWGTVWREHLDHLMDHPLGQGQGAVPDVDRQEQLGDGIERCPHPVGRAGQAGDRFGLAELAGLHRAEQSKEFVQLHLGDPHIVQEIL